MKTCPYCAEEIQENAIKCKHCGEIISKEEDGIIALDEYFYLFVISIVIGIISNFDDIFKYGISAIVIGSIIGNTLISFSFNAVISKGIIRLISLKLDTSIANKNIIVIIISVLLLLFFINL